MSLAYKEQTFFKLDLLKRRSAALKKARGFFEQRDYIEVDCPALCKHATIDAHIDPIETEVGYLHTSAEYLMKRLLFHGLEKIYQICHVFRKDEVGKKHNPEFTMIEWYQKDLSFIDMIDETIDFLDAFISFDQIKKLTYKEAFSTFVQIDPFQVTIDDLKKTASLNEIYIDSSLEIDDWLQILFTHVIEPNMESNILYIIYDFPKTQAALAQTDDNVAKRFEIFFQGIELANGYLELIGKDEHIKRFERENYIRQKHGKKVYPLDEKFLQATEHLPFCSGVSVGFDRLLMIALQKNTIQDVISFSFEEL